MGAQGLKIPPAARWTLGIATDPPGLRFKTSSRTFSPPSMDVPVELASKLDFSHGIKFREEVLN